MAENLNLQLTVDTSGATTSVGSLKKQLREAQNEVMSLADKFGATSKEAINAAKRAAELKDAIGDAKALTDAFNPDAKFKALTSSLSGLAGGFGAIQGAMALFGVESDNVQKTLLKVQSAMAISQGLQSVGESIDSFRQLGAVIQSSTIFQKANTAATQAAGVVQKLFTGSVDTTSTGFKNLKLAMAATGIGLLIVAIGALIANFDELTNAISNTSDVEQEHSKAQEAASKAVADYTIKLYSVQNALEAAKKGTISKKDALKEYNDKLGDSIGYAGSLQQAEQLMAANTAIVIKSIKLKAEAQVMYAKAAEYSSKIVSGETTEIGFWEGFYNYASSLGDWGGAAVKNAEDMKNKVENAKKAITSLQEEGDKLTNEALENDKLIKKGLDKKPETDKKSGTTTEQELEKERERLRKQQDQILQDELDAFEKRNEQRKKLGLEAVGLDGLTDKERAQKKEDDDKRKAADEKRNQEFTEESNKNGLGKILAIRAAAIVAEQKQDEDNLAAKRRLAELEIENKQETSYAIADIVSGLSGIIGQNTAEGKAIAIASATIDTYLAASTIFKQAAKNPITTINPAYPYLMAAPAILSGIARVKQIASVQVPKGGGGGGGGNMPSMSSAAPMSPQTPQAQTTNISQASINQMGNQAVRAYVIETDVTSNQQRVEAIKQRARFS
jgi:hypothetical protein